MNVRLIYAAVAMSVYVVNANATPIDLTPWTAESYPIIPGDPAAVWQVAPGGGSVTQTMNGQPTLFYSDFTAFGTKITGNIKSATVDDDFIGFAIGFNPGDASNPLASYLLVDWKKATQLQDFGAPSNSPGGNGLIGLSVSQVFGVPDFDELWQHKNLAGTDAASGVTELARGSTLGSAGWASNTDYAFEFDIGPSALQVFVNGIKELDITGSFTDGRMAFYDFSQPSTTYSAFDAELLPPSAVAEPATWPLLGAGLGFVAAMRRRSRNILQRACATKNSRR